MGFKPCYKWNTFNTKATILLSTDNPSCVLNLVISGIPSIQGLDRNLASEIASFKPCYKWNTFNTEQVENADTELDTF